MPAHDRLALSGVLTSTASAVRSQVDWMTTKVEMLSVVVPFADTYLVGGLRLTLYRRRKRP
jgi:hypothetical protein